LEQALAIENELNKVQFDGIEFGGIMADYIYQSLYFHSQNVGIKTQIYNQLLYYKLLFDRSVASN
jgi:hypothetical protein